VSSAPAGNGTCTIDAGDVVRFHAACRPAAPGAAVTSRAPPSSSFLPCLVSNLRLSTRRTNGVVEAHRGELVIRHSGGGAHPCYFY